MKEHIDNKQVKSSQWLAHAYEQNPHAIRDEPFLRTFRKQQWERFLQRGLPTRREESWKYTDFSFMDKTVFQWPLVNQNALPRSVSELIVTRARENNLLVFINGYYVPQYSRVSDLAEGVILCTLHEALRRHTSLLSTYLLRDLDAKAHPLSCLNSALMADGIFVYVPRSVTLKKSLQILSIAQGSAQFMIQPRHVVILENEAELTLIDESLNADADYYFSNIHADFFVGRSARLNYYKIQNEARNAKHAANVFFHQKQDSQVNACSFAIGGQFSRNDFTALLQEPGAFCRMNGFYGLDSDGQLIDHHLYIDHAAPYTRSEIDFRGVLAGRSRAVFNGKVIAQPGSKKVEALQFNHNILLSTLAEVNTKPELEIYVDEVQCRHGATVGQLDEEALFYLRTRGIEPRMAKLILLQALMENALNQVTLPWLVQYMHAQWGKCVERLG